MQNFYNQIATVQSTTNKSSANPSIEKLASMTTLSREQVKAVVSAEPWTTWGE